MSDRYPYQTSYLYCGNNPINIVDPDGDSVKFATHKEEEYINQLLDHNSKVYSRTFEEKFTILANAKDYTYTFECWDFDENRSESGLFSPKIYGATIRFTMGLTPETDEIRFGFSEYRNLFEEVYHAWSFESNHRKQIEPSCWTEANAWKFSTEAPGTRLTCRDPISYLKRKTLMNRIKTESVGNIAVLLKFGGKYNENGYGLKVGKYSNLPLFSHGISNKVKWQKK
ncbi:MAG: hypothetical protein ACTTJH_08155 [Bacteroidales bacterium]